MKINLRSIEKAVRISANRIGIDIKRYRDELSEPARTVKMLQQHGVELVVDIGANRGQYAKLLRRYGYQRRILSFEPLQDAWNELQETSRNDSEWNIFPRCAIGESRSSVTMNVSENSVSSSILEMLDQHTQAAPESAYIRAEQAQCMPLDEALAMMHDLPQKIFIKIDTQGYEEKVLDGASDVLLRAIGIQIELSLVPLYAGQELYPEIIERLTSLGFEIWSIFPGLTEQRSGRMLQCDAVLFKSQAGCPNA